MRSSVSNAAWSRYLLPIVGVRKRVRQALIAPTASSNPDHRGDRDEVRTRMRPWSACLRPCWSPSAARLVSERLRRSDDPTEARRPWGSSVSTSRSCARAASRVKGSALPASLPSDPGVQHMQNPVEHKAIIYALRGRPPQPNGCGSDRTRSGSVARYTRRSAHAWTTCSGTASNSRGFSCITYSFSMW